jgi:hypothetical protein
MNHPEPINFQITPQDMLFLRAALVRYKGQLGVDPSFAHTAHVQASNSTAFGGCLILVGGLIAIGYFLWNREWGVAVVAFVGTLALSYNWRQRSVDKMRIDALMNQDLFAMLWASGKITIRFPDGTNYFRSATVIQDLRARFPELDAKFSNA